jgi:predicted nucleotidyltransferase
MAKRKVLAAIRFFEEQLRENEVEVAKIVLFGSQAKGTASVESDVDIIVISRNFKNKNIFKRLALIKDAKIATIRKYMIPLDVIMMTPDEVNSGTSLVSEYAREGEVVSLR